MISLIICSRQPDIPQELKDNIAETIGVEYELVVIDNSKNQYSFFQAYNEGVRRSQYPYLCFMHDDVLYHTQDWGTKVVEHFKDDKVGMIGVAGGHCMLNTPSSWWHSGLISKNYIQNDFNQINKEIQSEFLSKSNFNLYNNSVEVVAVDGFWFCLRKSLFTTIHFDEINYKSFHCYDLDICFQVRNIDYKIFVVSNILLEHFSHGTVDSSLIEYLKIFYNKWKEQLPQIAGIKISQHELEIRTEFVNENFELLKYLIKSQSELANIRKSKTYRLGKFILKPFNFISNIFKNKQCI